MIEGLWALLLAIAVSRRGTRPLAFLLACKWAANYSAALAGFWTAPAFLDIAFGTVGVVLAFRQPPRVASVLMAAFVIAPLVHAWHWSLWSASIYVGVQYFNIMLGLHTAQVVALAWPKGSDLVRSCVRLLDVPRRRHLASSSDSVGGCAARSEGRKARRIVRNSGAR